jgi:hypothetical protein
LRVEWPKRWNWMRREQVMSGHGLLPLRISRAPAATRPLPDLASHLTTGEL